MVVASWASGAACERRGRDDTNHKRPEASTHAAPTASKEDRLKAGQGYRWKIKAATDFEYGLIAPAFFRNIWIRKIETARSRSRPRHSTSWSSKTRAKVELFFVAAEERGMVGTIIVESGDDS